MNELKMIQGATRSIWSHVGLLFRVESLDRVLVMESLEPVGVRTVPLSQYLRNYDARGNPYPGRMCILRHRDFEHRASPDCLTRFGGFAAGLDIPHDPRGFVTPADFATDPGMELVAVVGEKS